MPLTPGAPIGDSISELIASYKRKGKIGNSTPKNKASALKQAIAIAYRNKKEGNG